MINCGPLAQSVEQRTFNPLVVGSTPTGPTMTNELNLHNQLHLGDIVGDSKRMVIACTKLAEREPGESFAHWVAICVKDGEYHPYAVWTVIARPEGWVCQNGDYAHSLSDALEYYTQRGGKA